MCVSVYKTCGGVLSVTSGVSLANTKKCNLEENIPCFLKFVNC